jgi:hypothetical protein
MWLVRLSAFDEGQDLRTFECQVCEHTESMVVNSGIERARREIACAGAERPRLKPEVFVNERLTEIRPSGFLALPADAASRVTSSCNLIGGQG